MKILLVQTSFLGDTVLSTPVIAGLKVKHPGAELWMMTTALSADLVRNDPLLSGVIVFDKRKGESGPAGIFRKARELRAMKFDMVYSLHRSYRTALLLFLSGIPQRIAFSKARLSFLYSRLIDRPSDQHDVIRNLSLLSDSRQVSAQDLLNRYPAELRLFLPDGFVPRPELSGYTEKPYVVLVPGSAWKTKMWHWERYREAAQHYIACNMRVLLLGAASEAEITGRVAHGLDVADLAGKTSLVETMYFIKHASLVICNDSMSLHLASSFKTPNVAVFCATSPKFGFSPWKNRAIVVEKEGLSCKPCRRHGSNVCPTGTEACMKDLPASKVTEAGDRLIGAGQMTSREF